MEKTTVINRYDACLNRWCKDFCCSDDSVLLLLCHEDHDGSLCSSYRTVDLGACGPQSLSGFSYSTRLSPYFICVLAFTWIFPAETKVQKLYCQLYTVWLWKSYSMRVLIVNILRSAHGFYEFTPKKHGVPASSLKTVTLLVSYILSNIYQLVDVLTNAPLTHSTAGIAN